MIVKDVALAGKTLSLPTLLALLTAATRVHTLADELKPAEATAKPEAIEQKLKAETDAKTWIANAFQLDDKAKRKAAIESIRAAMAGRTRITTAGAFGILAEGRFLFPPLSPVPRNPPTIESSATAETLVAVLPRNPPKCFEKLRSLPQ